MNLFHNIVSRFSGTIAFAAVLSIAMTASASAVTNTASAGTTWEAATWSQGHVPLATEDAVINSGINLSINSAAVCGTLTIGNATATATTLTINAGYSLTISGTTGNLTMNPSNVNVAMTLAVGANTLTVAGTPVLSATNTSSITASTGAVSFTNAAGFTWASGTITRTGAGITSFTGLLTQTGGTIQNTTAAGTFTFNGGYTKSAGTFTSMAAETINLGGNLTVSTTALTFNATSTVNFTASAIVTPTAAITFGNITLTAGTQTLAGNIAVAGNWTDNGGTLSAGTYGVTFSGTKTISGTSSTAFGPITIAAGAVRTMNNSNSCTNLTFTASGTASSLTHGTTSALTVSGNVVINQPTAAVVTAWFINAGSATIAGTTTIGGTTATTGYIARITVTTGSVKFNSTVSFASNTLATTEVIRVTSSGSITFTQPLTLSSGTVSNLTAAGTLNFNAAVNFGGANTPALSTMAASIVNFGGNLTAATTALTFNATSTETFTASATITPTAAITFGNVTLTGGTQTIAGSITVAGSWTNNGSTVSAGTYTQIFSGAAKTIGGTSSTAFGVIQINSGATITMNNNNSCTGLTFVAAGTASSLTHGGTSVLTVNGNVLINQPTANTRTSAWNINAGSATVTGTTTVGSATSGTASRISQITVTTGTLNLNGTTTISTAASSACAVITVSTGIINFNAALSHGEGTISITSTGTINFNSTYAFGPTLSAAPILTTVAGANLTFGNNFTVSVALTLNATSNSTFTANSTVTPTANIVFGNVTVNTGVTITTANGAGTLSIAGNTLISGTGNLGGAGTEPVLFTGASKTIDGTGTIAATTTVSGAQTFLATANLTVSDTMTINNAVTVTNNGIVNSTAAGGIIGGGATATWTNGASSSLIVAGPFLATNGVLNASNSGNTVNYSGAAQTVKLPSGAPATYWYLTLSGSGIVTMPATIMTIGGDFIMSGTASAAAAQALTINGSFNISTGSNVFSGGSFSHTIGANWTNAGTFNGNTSTVTLSGTNASISGTGTYNINNLIITGSGANAAGTTNLTIAGNFSTSGSGTFTHASNGTLTMSGTSTTISGSGIVLNNLSVTGLISTTASLTITGNFAASGTGSFSATAGTLTLSGTSAAISNSGSGALQFYAMTISGGISLTTGFSISSNLTVNGSLNASAGTVTFNGSSILSGTANLYNITLNGTLLQIGVNSTLGVAGALALTSGTFNATTNSPNTVIFNGSGAQAVPAIAYYNLQTATGGIKTAGGTIIVKGDFTIGAGSTFNAGTYTDTVYGNWVNSGSFTDLNSTIIFAGANDVALTGATTFSSMTVNKNASTNIVTLNSNMSVSTLNMTNGELSTGVNSVTITATRTGNGIIIGTITRTHVFFPGISYAFESPYNTVNFSSVGSVTSVTVKDTLAAPADFPFGGSTNRQYTNYVTGSGYTATLRLHYLDAALNGNNEATMTLWRYNGSVWISQGKTANDTVNNWVELSGITDITNRWCLSDDQNVVQWNGSASSAWAAAGNWTAIQGSPSTPPGSNDVVSLGTAAFTNQPTITTAVNVKSLQFGSSQAVVLTMSSGGSLAVNGNINGVWSSNVNHTIAVGTQSLTVNGDLILSDGTINHTIGLTINSGTVNVTGSLTESGSAPLTFSGAGSLNIGTNFIWASGTFAPGTSTVTYNGSTSQTVAGLTYNDLTIASTAGTASTSSAVTVGGALTLSASAILSLGASLGVTGDITINSGTSLQANSSAISLGGNWNNTGSFIASTSTVAFNGTGSQTIAATTWNNLVINKSSGTASLSGNVTVNGDLSVSNGAFDVSSFTANRGSAGGTFTLSAGTTLRLSGSNNFPVNYSTSSLNTASTVEFYGASAQTINALTYGNLTLTNGGSNAKSLSGSTICNSILINSGATLAAGSQSLNVQGGWTNSGSFSSGTGTATLSGSSKSLAGTTTFNNLTVTGSYTASNDITVNAAMNVFGGTYAAGSTTTTFSGDFSNTGSFTSSGIVNFSGTTAQTIALNSGFSTTGTTNFNGTVAPIFNSTSSPNFAILNINNSAGVSPSRAWNISGAFTVAAGAAFYGGNATHTFSGSFTNNGTVTSVDGTLRFTPASPVTITLNGTTFSSTGLGTIEFGGAGFITISGAPTTLTNVLISNTNGSGITPATAWWLNGDLTIDNGSVFNCGSALSYTIDGDINNNGILNGGTSTITLDGTLDVIGGSGTTSFNNLIITGSITANSNYNFTGNFTVNGTYSESGGIIATSLGSSASNIGGTSTPISFENLVINKTSATTTLSAGLSDLTFLTLQSGTLDAGTDTITENTGVGTMTMEAGTTLKIGGNAGVPSFTSYTLDPASTIEYNGSGAQTIPGFDYSNLTISGVHNGSITLDNSDTIRIAGAFTTTATFTSGGYINTGSTVDYNGNAQTIGAFNYYNLSVSGDHGNQNITLANGTVRVYSIFDTSSADNVNNYITTGNTFEYNGSSAQSIEPFTYNNITISNTGTKTAATSFIVGGNLTVGSASNLTLSTSVTIQVLGKAITAGALANNGNLLISN